MADLIRLAHYAMSRIYNTGSYSNLILNSLIRDNDLNQKESAFLSRIVYGTLEKGVTLDYIISQNSNMPLDKLSPDVRIILQLGLYQIYFMDSVTDNVAVNGSVELTKKVCGLRVSGFVNAVLRSAIRHGEIPMPPRDKDIRAYLSVKYSCPEWLVSKWIKTYGRENIVPMLDHFSREGNNYIRVNSIKTTEDELIGILAQEGITASKTRLKNCLQVNNIGRLSKLRAFADGLFHIQDISSQLCVSAMDPRENMTVVDVCAAPGGKTLTAAQYMNNTGRLYCFDLYEQRVSLIKDGAQRLGITNIEPGVRDAAKGSADIQADCVLCDVPCSGLGVIRKKPEIKYKNPDEFKELSAVQYSILENSSKMVKSGGRLVYSTCTLSRAENEKIVEQFLKSHKDFKLVEPIKNEDILDLCGYSQKSIGVTFLPHFLCSDGFYIAAMERKLPSDSANMNNIYNAIIKAAKEVSTNSHQSDRRKT
ncbi:MAG: 16S rRNA (cytosine(967)-C(5))-methyltransferase RsmB [Clostridia bacterium]|nr:16S rRNA (cytosine(967)-C(5))-methyltransferase RsmB [Clostridia bacterium]